MSNKVRVFLVCLFIALGMKLALGQTRRINPDLKPYLNEFIMEAQERGIDVSHIFNQDIIIDYWGRDNGNVATSYGRDKDRVVIFVDESRFKARTEQGRKYVMFHEFGHDILNLPHLEHGMMRPSSYSGFFKDGVDVNRQNNYLNKSIDGLFDTYLERNGDGIYDKPRAGYIYIINNPKSFVTSPTMVKIGLTTQNPPIKRVNQHSSSVPFDYEVLAFVKTDDVYATEKEIHAALDDYIVNPNKEFFEVDFEVIKETVERLGYEVIIPMKW